MHAELALLRRFLRTQDVTLHAEESEHYIEAWFGEAEGSRRDDQLLHAFVETNSRGSRGQTRPDFSTDAD